MTGGRNKTTKTIVLVRSLEARLKQDCRHLGSTKRGHQKVSNRSRSACVSRLYDSSKDLELRALGFYIFLATALNFGIIDLWAIIRPLNESDPGHPPSAYTQDHLEKYHSYMKSELISLQVILYKL